MPLFDRVRKLIDRRSESAPMRREECLELLDIKPSVPLSKELVDTAFIDLAVEIHQESSQAVRASSSSRHTEASNQSKVEAIEMVNMAVKVLHNELNNPVEAGVVAARQPEEQQKGLSKLAQEGAVANELVQVCEAIEKEIKELIKNLSLIHLKKRLEKVVL